ncbi:hypothetical protein M758_3G045600 [Ceratodon purpureus]|nr:hypothetical protein M758_3G045600 [Ceratodon purpureus]
MVMEAGASSSEKGNAAAMEIAEAQRLFDDGCDFMRNESFDDAAQCFSQALEYRVRHFGELAPECATTYYKYGCALFDKLQDEADPLGETVNPNSALPSSNGEGSSGKESEVTGKDPVDEADGDEGDEDEAMGEGEEGKEEEDGDLEDAWKMLEFARVIHEKQGLCTIETVDIITKLADVNCFKENYESCYDDYTKALEMLRQVVEPDSRILAELYFKIAIAHQLDLKPKEALKYCSCAVAVCEARVQRLKHELAKTQGEGVDPLGSPGTASEGKQPEPETNGRMKGIEQETDDLVKDDEAKDDMEEKSGPESMATEIKDIEDLLVDLKDKEEELKEMASAPSLVEALQAANPEAAASVKQLFALAAGSQASGSGGTSSSSAVADGVKTSNGFDQPSLANFSSSTAVVTDLGVVGRGIKRAEPVAVAAGGSTSREGALPSKKRSFDMLMNGTGNGETQVGFGESSVKLENESTT